VQDLHITLPSDPLWTRLIATCSYSSGNAQAQLLVPFDNFFPFNNFHNPNPQLREFLLL